MRLRVDWVIVCIALAAAVICVLWTAWALHSPQFSTWWLRDADATVAGAWGDSFGAFNALFGALGFSAVLATLLLQGRSLSRQQQDQVRQRFDDTFFRLLSLLREVRAEIVYTRNTVKNAEASEGYIALKEAANDAFYHILKSYPDVKPENRSEVAQLYSDKVHMRSEHGFGPYFRLIYTVLRRIDESKFLDSDERIKYSNLLRGQLGSPEIALLALNGLTPVSKDLGVYIVRYRMLKYIAQEEVRNVLSSFYAAEAFQGRD